MSDDPNETVDETVIEIADETAVEETVEQAVDESASTPAPAGPRRNRLVLFSAAALVVSVLLAGSVYWFVSRPDRLTDQQARDQVLEAARTGTVAVLTYSPETVEKDLSDAKSRLTGDFLKQYNDFTTQTVVPAAKNAGVKTEATVTRAAVSQMKPGSAQVLVFVNQVTTSRARPTPALATSSVIVTLVDQGGHWLISDFKPV